MTTLHALADAICWLEAEIEATKREFGERLRQERMKAGVTLKAVARAAVYSHTQVCKVERGWVLVTGDGARILADALETAREKAS